MNKEHAYINQGQLSSDNISFYAEYGYLIANNLLTANEILVAGENPYEYKGTADLNQAYLRPEILKIRTH